MTTIKFALNTKAIGSYLRRAGLTALQTFVSSIAVTQLITAAEHGDLSALEQIGLAALAAAVGATISFLKNVAFDPTDTGVAGVIERAVSTFVQAAAAAIPLQVLVSSITNRDLHGLEAVGLAALNGGIAAVLSLMQHLGQLPASSPANTPAFVFRGAEESINLRAQGLPDFVHMSSGIDAATWQFHLEQKDYSRWIRQGLADQELAQAVEDIEQSGESADQTRSKVIAAVQRRYRL